MQIELDSQESQPQALEDEPIPCRKYQVAMQSETYNDEKFQVPEAEL